MFSGYRFTLLFFAVVMISMPCAARRVRLFNSTHTLPTAPNHTPHTPPSAATTKTPIAGEVHKVAKGARNDVAAAARSARDSLGSYMRGLHRTGQEEWRYWRNKDEYTGDDKSEAARVEDGYSVAKVKKGVADNALSAALATALTLIASFGFERLAKTRSQQRNKKMLVLGALVSSWYGASLQCRPTMSGRGVSHELVRDRVMFVGALTGLFTLAYNVARHIVWNQRPIVVQQGGKQAHLNVRSAFGSWSSGTTEKPNLVMPIEPCLRDHCTWALEMAATQMLAMALGYQCNRYRFN